MSKKGKLYLIPVPLGEAALHTIPAYVIELVHRLDVFVAERAKTARHFIKATGISRPLQELEVSELDKHAPDADLSGLLTPALAGRDIGLLSEAGCPAVADPGSKLVQLAHEEGIEVVPLVGPSAILLALMASGMNGQNFCFHGYLSPSRPELVRDLKRIEQNASRFKQTQIFIETPYRNRQLIEEAVKTLSPHTRFCIAADLTTREEYIATKTIAQWRKSTIPDLHKHPAIFLLS